MPVREFSAGGVVVRLVEGLPEVAVIKPAGRNTVALPKGHIDQGETAQQAATREVREETGLSVTFDQLLGDVRYVYRFRGRTISKVVTFFLFRYGAGEIGQIDEAMRVEVDRAWWLPLPEALARLSFPGERDMVARAAQRLGAPPSEA